MASEAFAQLEAQLLRDPGQRGAAHLVRRGCLEPAARALLGAPRVALLTGFPILRAGQGETDGPGATVALGDALRALGSEVVYLTDPLCAPLLRALDAAPLEVLELRPGDRAGAQATLARLAPTHLVAIERPGRAQDGHYRNMQGLEIDALTSGLDELFLAAEGRVTVAIGDGGNELGLASARDAVARHVPHGAEIATVVGADHAIAAGVSEWGGLVLVAALSLLAGRDLLPSAEEVGRRLEALVAAGAVDGVTARPEPSVDGRPLSETLALLAELRALSAG
ncbi:MAG: DUF4392 domain-containing protein [Planctomycetota bacterium]